MNNNPILLLLVLSLFCLSAVVASPWFKPSIKKRVTFDDDFLFAVDSEDGYDDYSFSDDSSLSSAMSCYSALSSWSRDSSSDDSIYFECLGPDAFVPPLPVATTDNRLNTTAPLATPSPQNNTATSTPSNTLTKRKSLKKLLLKTKFKFQKAGQELSTQLVKQFEKARNALKIKGKKGSIKSENSQ